jgi:hypothetical protein
MAKEDKKLKIEKLEHVTGGNRKELDELKEAILSNPDLARVWRKYLSDPKLENNEDMTTAYLIYKLTDIDMEWSDNEKNVYSYGDYSHDEILDFLKNYRR